MALIKTDAIVLRRRHYSESSLVVTLFGRDRGRLDALAKGCRREKSPLFGHLDLYQREEALILERPQAGLDILLEASFLDEHAGLRFSPPAFAAAGLLSELAAEAVFPGDPQPGLYDTLAGALCLLADLGGAEFRIGLAAGGGFSRPEREALIGRTVKLALLDMLAWLGFGLELGRCVGCDRRPGSEEKVWLSRSRGGLVCRSCRDGGGRPPVGGLALSALRDRGEGSEKLEMALPATERRRWLKFLIEYAQQVLEKPLRSADVLFQTW